MKRALALCAGLLTTQAALAIPTLFSDSIRGSTQIAGINALEFGGYAWNVRWYDSHSYYQDFSSGEPTFMGNASGADQAAAAIRDFFNGYGAISGDIGFQSTVFHGQDATGNPYSFTGFNGMLPTSYRYNALYQRWEANGAAFTLQQVLDPASGSYTLEAASGGFGSITNETGPGGRGIISNPEGWAYVTFQNLGALGAPTPPAPGGQASAVPEPTTATLLLTGIAGLLGMRRRATQ